MLVEEDFEDDFGDRISQLQQQHTEMLRVQNEQDQNRKAKHRKWESKAKMLSELGQADPIPEIKGRIRANATVYHRSTTASLHAYSDKENLNQQSHSRPTKTAATLTETGVRQAPAEGWKCKSEHKPASRLSQARYSPNTPSTPSVKLGSRHLRAGTSEPWLKVMREMLANKARWALKFRLDQRNVLAFSGVDGLTQNSWPSKGHASFEGLRAPSTPNRLYSPPLQLAQPRAQLLKVRRHLRPRAYL